MVVLGVLASLLLFPLCMIRLIFEIVHWWRGKSLCHHSKVSRVQVRHHREICCEEAERWGEEAREIWGDILKDHPKLSRVRNVLDLRPLPWEGGRCTTEGIAVDLRKRESEDGVRGTIAHELHHRMQNLRFGWRVLVKALFEIPARRRYKREVYYNSIYYYLCFPSEMAALVFSANYSRAEAKFLRRVRRSVNDHSVWEVVARLRGKRRRKR